MQMFDKPFSFYIKPKFPWKLLKINVFCFICRVTLNLIYKSKFKNDSIHHSLQLDFRNTFDIIAPAQ